MVPLELNLIQGLPKNGKLGSGLGNSLIPDNLRMPYLLLGHDLLAKANKAKAEIHFSNGGAKFLSEYGKPIHILVTNMTDEYRLHHVAIGPDPQLERWLQEFPSAKTGGLGVVSLPPPHLCGS